MDSTSESEREHLFSSALELLDKSAIMVMTHLEGLEREEQLEELRKTMLQYCRRDHEWTVEKKVLKDIRKMISDEDFSFDETYEELKRKQYENFIPNNHPWYKRFEKKLDTEQNNGTQTAEMEDDELTNTGEKQSFQDPFTKQIMQQPMKNKKCGHSYDRVAVISMLKTKKNLRCPYAFCNAHIVEKDLQENIELLNEIRRSQGNV